MKNKLFILIAIVAFAGAILFIFSGGEGENKKSTDGKTTEVDESDDDRTEVAAVYTVTDEGPKSERGVIERGVMKRTSPMPSMKFSKDIDKVLKSVEGLKSVGKTELGGRRGKSAGFNEGFAASERGVMKMLASRPKTSATYNVAAGSGGISDGLGGLLGGSAKTLTSSKSISSLSSTKAMAARRSEPAAIKSSERVMRKKASSFRESSSRDVYLVSDSDEGDADEISSRKSRRKRSYSDRQKSGLLTAGEWNDLDNWDFWTDLFNENAYYEKMNYWRFFPKKLVAVKVVDENKDGVANVSVILLNGRKVEFATKTDNEGYAYCWISLFDKYGSNFKNNDLMLIVDGTVINGQLKLTTRNSQRLNVNVVVDKDAKHAKSTADVAFIVDATGSMSDEIKFLKSDLSYIIDHASSESNVDIRTAALFYRDEGDAYLTRHDDFSEDVSKTQDFISLQSASGGGDYPEAVHSALEASLQDLSWDDGARARIAFLILDAPAHYEDHVIKSLQKSITLYAKHGIKLIPVAASGVNKDTEFMLRFFDLATGGTYVFLTDDSGIGDSHIKASVGNYQVEQLADLMVRLIKKYVK